MSLKKLSTEELRQKSFIELAYELLSEKKQAITFNELLKEMGKLQELSESELRSRMVQFYTDLNVDGRFIALGENRWGIRAWYPVDQIEEETVPTIKTRKKKSKKAEDDVEEDFDEEDLDFDDLDDLDEEDLTDDDDDLDDDEDLDADEDEEEVDDELIDEDEYDLGDDEEEDDDTDADDEEEEKEDK